MEVVVSAERGARPEWRHKFAPETSTVTLSKWLCDRLEIDAGQCQLYYQGTLLTDQPLKQVQQIGNRVLRLAAAVDTALNVCLWQSLPSTVNGSVTEFWLQAVACLANQQHWTLLRLGSSQTLSDLVALPNGDRLPDDIDFTTDITTSSYWSAVSTPAKPLVVLMQTYLHMTALHNRGTPQNSCVQQGLQHLNAQMQQLALRLESTAPAHTTDTYIKHLRACFLVLKMLQLLTTIKIPDSLLEQAIQSLQEATIATSQAVKENKANCNGHIAKQAEVLLMPTTRLALSTSRQLSKSQSLGLRASSSEWFRKVLAGLIPSSSSEVFPHFVEGILESGIIPALVMGLDGAEYGSKAWADAHAAFKLLDRLMASEEEHTELTHKVQAVLLRMQAVPRLCKLLQPCIPGWLRSVEHQWDASEEQQGMWIAQHASKQLPKLQRIVDRIHKLLDSTPPPQHPDKTLPTPTPAAWEAIQYSVQVAIKTAPFYSIDDSTIWDFYPGNAMECIFTCDWPFRLRDLKPQLETLPGKLLAGHMPNLDLDVTKLMRFHLQKLLLTDNAMKKPETENARLLTLFLERLHKEPALLHHHDEELNLNKKGITRHIVTGAVCEGCPDCNGPVWHFKSSSVAMLWALCCHCCTKPEAHHIAAITVDAAYNVLAQAEHCKHILLRTHMMTNVNSQADDTPEVGSALRGLGVNLTAQLTLAACLARLCTQELQRAGRPAAATTSWFSTALQDKTFDVVYASLQSAVDAPTPWSMESCIAVARALQRLAELQAAQSSGSAFRQFQEQQSQQLLEKLVQKVAKIHQDAAAKQFLMNAVLQILLAADAEDSTHISAVKDEPKKKELVLNLIDLLIDPAFSPDGQPLASNSSQVGLNQQPIGALHTSILGLVATCLPKDVDICRHFWQHAMPMLPQWFHIVVTIAPRDAASKKIFATICEGYSRWHPKDMHAVPPSEFAAAAMQRSIIDLFTVLIELRQDLLNIRTVMLKQNREESKKSGACASEVEATMAEVRDALEFVANKFHLMQRDAMWKPVLTDLQRDPQSSPKHRQELAKLRQVLATASEHKKGGSAIMSARLLDKLEACFVCVGKDEPDKAAESAAELVQQEDAAAAKAAAKKAKKLKQKAKKQQAQQLSPGPPTSPADTNSSLDDNSIVVDDSEMEDSSVPPRTPPKTAIQKHNSADSPDGTLTSVVQDEAPKPDQAALAMDIAADAVPTSQAEVSPGGKESRSDSLKGLHDAASGATVGEGNQVQASTLEANADSSFLQDLFSCPITKATMKEPVIAADGYTYERTAIEGWLQKHSVSPVTGDFLAHMRVVPNVLVRNLISGSQQ